MSLSGKKKHKHIWKHIVGKNYKICEAPFSFLDSCGKKELMIASKRDTVRNF